jgi:hypothetical protein
LLRLFGIAIQNPDAMALVAALLADGGEDATEAARAIVSGLEKQREAVPLTAAQRQAILAVIEVAETEGLAQLRGALIFDLEHQRRHG